MTWSKNNRACTTLWTTLFSLNQLNTNFDTSGTLLMKDLTFFNILSSSDMRQEDASIVADQLDNTFRNGRGAKFESNTDRNTALTEIISILTNEEKTVSDLAKIVDESYLFWGE